MLCADDSSWCYRNRICVHLDLINIAAEPYTVARSVEVEDMLDFSAIFIDIGGAQQISPSCEMADSKERRCLRLAVDAFTEAACRNRA